MSKPLCHGLAAPGAIVHWHPTDWHEAGPGAASRCLRLILVWVSRSRERRALAEIAAMNNHLLNDIGVSAEDAAHEAAKPFWRG